MGSHLIKTPEQLALIREGGRILASIFEELQKLVVEGNTSMEVDKYARFLCKKYKVKPAFLHYKGFPYAICANLNDVVVHGFATNKTFRVGDIFGLDMGIVYKGFNLDMSYTVMIHPVASAVENFVKKTETSMMQGIQDAIVGNTIGDISEAMRHGLVGEDFRLMRDFVGHGIGKNLHENPEIPGEGMREGEGMTIEQGMVFAIESISVMSDDNSYEIEENNWVVHTRGRRVLSGLFEHTVIIAEDGPEIVTVV